MLAIERKNEILSILQREKSVLVADLSQKYKVTEETIRRDLDKLEREGFVKKTYGGAVLNENTNIDLPFKIRERTNKGEKQIIARLVAGLIMEGESIMLDSSSTSLMVSKNLRYFKNLTVITNSVEILMELSDCKGIRLICTGGVMRESALSLGGKLAEQAILHYNADKAILSCKGLDMVSGVTDSNEFEADLKAVMCEHAKQIIWAVDSSKLGQTSFVKIKNLQKGDTIVTEKPLDILWQRYLEEKQVNLITEHNAIK